MTGERTDDTSLNRPLERAGAIFRMKPFSRQERDQFLAEFHRYAALDESFPFRHLRKFLAGYALNGALAQRDVGLVR